MGTWFEAKRDGRCPHCKKPFVTGDEVFAKNAGVYLCHECGLLADNLPGDVGAIEASVLQELSRLPMEASLGIYAQNMLYAARQLDERDVSPREVPVYQKEMRLNMLALQDAFPVTEDDDDTDEARRKRERRAREHGGF